MNSDLRHPLDARLIALSEQLANEVVTATAADLVMEARDAIAQMNMQMLMAGPVRLVPRELPGEIAREDFDRIDAGKIVPLDPKAELRVHCPACVDAQGQDAIEGEKPWSGRPPVVCLCGSTRFMDWFHAAGWIFTLRGWVVLSVGVAKHVQTPDGGHAAEALGEGVADRLDELHLRKIDMADLVFVLDYEGYVGESTLREMEYATRERKLLQVMGGNVRTREELEERIGCVIAAFEEDRLSLSPASAGEGEEGATS